MTKYRIIYKGPAYPYPYFGEELVSGHPDDSWVEICAGTTEDFCREEILKYHKSKTPTIISEFEL